MTLQHYFELFNDFLQCPKKTGYQQPLFWVSYPSLIRNFPKSGVNLANTILVSTPKIGTSHVKNFPLKMKHENTEKPSGTPIWASIKLSLVSEVCNSFLFLQNFLRNIFSLLRKKWLRNHFHIENSIKIMKNILKSWKNDSARQKYRLFH